MFWLSLAIFRGSFSAKRDCCVETYQNPSHMHSTTGTSDELVAAASHSCVCAMYCDNAAVQIWSPHQNLKCFTICFNLFCCCNHFGALNLTNHLHGTQSSACCLLGYLRYSPHGMEIEVSQTPPLVSVLSVSNQSPTAILFLLDTFKFYTSTHAYTFRVISFLQVFPPYTCISFLSHACHMSHPSHLP